MSLSNSTNGRTVGPRWSSWELNSWGKRNKKKKPKKKFAFGSEESPSGILSPCFSCLPSVDTWSKEDLFYQGGRLWAEQEEGSRLSPRCFLFSSCTVKTKVQMALSITKLCIPWFSSLLQAQLTPLVLSHASGWTAQIVLWEMEKKGIEGWAFSVQYCWWKWLLNLFYKRLIILQQWDAVEPRSPCISAVRFFLLPGNGNVHLQDWRFLFLPRSQEVVKIGHKQVNERHNQRQGQEQELFPNMVVFQKLLMQNLRRKSFTCIYIPLFH